MKPKIHTLTITMTARNFSPESGDKPLATRFLMINGWEQDIDESTESELAFQTKQCFKQLLKDIKKNLASKE